jgi:hypothetical protein
VIDGEAVVLGVAALPLRLYRAQKEHTLVCDVRISRLIDRSCRQIADGIRPRSGSC